jgi:hypothetical protein
MMKTNSDLANKSIEQILELSVDAHVRRRGTVRDSPEFHRLTWRFSPDFNSKKNLTQRPVRMKAHRRCNV